MVDSLLPEELPAVLLSNIARLYHHTYRMWRYLPPRVVLPHVQRERAVEIILLPKVHYHCC